MAIHLLTTIVILPYLHYPFFLKRSRHPPDLHSFPTRRSSDLTTDIRYWARGWTFPQEGPGGMLAEKSDRKSTRLNSSHLVISYAVFCLKKKKKIIIEQMLSHILDTLSDVARENITA